MNKFDQFVKHDLKVKFYARYTDDFMIISENKNYLEDLIPKIRSFLLENLKLDLHPKKVGIRKYAHGIDFLGYINFPHHRLVRAKTKRRIVRNLKNKVLLYKQGFISKEKLKASLQSYSGVLSHANARKFTENIKNQLWFLLKK